MPAAEADAVTTIAATTIRSIASDTRIVPRKLRAILPVHPRKNPMRSHSTSFGHDIVTVLTG